MNSRIDSSFRTYSSNIALKVRTFIAVLAGRRRRRFIVSRLLSIVIINNTTFWSFQLNSSIPPSFERLLYSVLHFRIAFHLILSSTSLESSSRLGSVCSRYILISFVASRFSRLVVIIRIVLAASNSFLCN